MRIDYHLINGRGVTVAATLLAGALVTSGCASRHDPPADVNDEELLGTWSRVEIGCTGETHVRHELSSPDRFHLVRKWLPYGAEEGEVRYETRGTFSVSPRGTVRFDWSREDGTPRADARTFAVLSPRAAEELQGARAEGSNMWTPEGYLAPSGDTRTYYHERLQDFGDDRWSDTRTEIRFDRSLAKIGDGGRCTARLDMEVASGTEDGGEQRERATFRLSCGVGVMEDAPLMRVTFDGFGTDVRDAEQRWEQSVEERGLEMGGRFASSFVPLLLFDPEEPEVLAHADAGGWNALWREGDAPDGP